MTFTKAFPKRIAKSNFPQWMDITLSDEEEREIESKAKQESIRLFSECIEDAKKIMESSRLKPFQSNLVDIAITLFDKRASHVVFWKESKCREKFDKLH
ncbi:MAG: hypothetical protein KJ709_07540 [Nanoarchaeota archaeon]|nr:hypothetical protein [Nanoarchaeota archaeon]